jgi:hypothetical protein
MVQDDSDASVQVFATLEVARQSTGSLSLATTLEVVESVDRLRLSVGKWTSV